MSATLSLSGELTIGAAAAQHGHLLAALAPQADSNAELMLNLSAIEGFDSAGLQLLLAARNSLASQGRSLRLVEVSAPVQQALTTYGLDHLLQSQIRSAP
jgi:anti-anti-sigma factor